MISSFHFLHAFIEIVGKDFNDTPILANGGDIDWEIPIRVSQVACAMVNQVLARAIVVVVGGPVKSRHFNVCVLGVEITTVI